MQLYERCNDVIQEYLQQEVCEEEKNTSAIEQASTGKYYMPCHPVILDNKETTKLRIVFDASSHKEGSPSLNDLFTYQAYLKPRLTSCAY